MVVVRNGYTIQLDAEDYYVAEALFDVASQIENDDLLDDHYTVVIRKNK